MNEKFTIFVFVDAKLITKSITLLYSHSNKAFMKKFLLFVLVGEC